LPFIIELPFIFIIEFAFEFWTTAVFARAFALVFAVFVAV